MAGEGRVVNGYTIQRKPATPDGTPLRWTVTRPDGTTVGEYPTLAQAEQSARSFLTARRKGLR